MDTLVFLLIVAVVAFLVAWVVNLVVGWISGEHPGDTGRQAVDVFFGIFGGMRLGLLARLLDRSTFPWVRWIIYFAGAWFIVAMILRGCSHP